MSVLSLLRTHGVQVRSVDGELRLSGLGPLPADQARQLVNYARQNKAAILAEVEAQAEHPKDQYTRLCPDYWQTCVSCPDGNMSSIYFCRKLRDQEGRWLQ